MRAGRLRHTVIIQTPTATKDSFNADVVTWGTFATVRASIEQLKAYDKAAAASTWPGADYTVSMRYLPGVTSKMRIVWGSMIFSICGQPNNVDGRNRELIFTCQSGTREA